jgi:hypothetical protein
MEANFTNAQKKQKYYLIALVVVAVGAGLIMLLKFLPKAEQPQISASAPLNISKIEINWSTVANSKIVDLKIFENIAEFAGELGRINPFESY